MNSSAKYLCNQNEDDLQPINTQFSGIFNKSSKIFTQENLNLLNKNRKSPQLSESSNSTVETIDYEFLTPHSKTKVVRHHVTSSPIKELNLSEYFGKFMEKPKLLQNLDEKQIIILRKVSKNVPVDGNISFKTNAANDITNVIYYNPFYSKAIHHNIMTPEMLGLLEKPLVCPPSTSQQIPVDTPPVKPIPVKRKVGRPRNDSKRPIEKEIESFEEDDLVSHRTKSGRIVKLNPEIAKIFQSEPPVIVSSSQPLQIQAPAIHTPIIDVVPLKVEPTLLPGLAEPPKKPRKISSEFRCTTCKKIYLGKNKMNNHFKLFPDHRPKTSDTESVLFSHLMTMVRQKKKNKEMADVFFKEISNFVQICEKLTPRLITNKDNHPNTHHHVVDKNAASLLRINPGNYRLNMNVFDKNFKLDNPVEEPPPDEPEEQPEVILDSSDNHDDHQDDIIHQAVPLVNGNEVIKALDQINVPSLDDLLIRQTNELTNLTNISDIVGETEKIDDGDNALLGF